MPQEIPLHLSQVLEEEYENLHDELFNETIRFGGREARVEEDWLFHWGHVNARKLLQRLETAQNSWERGNKKRQSPLPKPKPGDASLDDENDLATFLVFRFPQLLDELRAAKENPADLAHVKTLNEILRDRDGKVFRRERFERIKFRDTKELLEQGWCERMEADRRRGQQDDERGDYMLFKRLLMEGVFSSEVARVFDIRLARIYRRIHALTEKRTAVCLSGGGIRSGSFALGVLQSLARHRLLERFDYLSTVSGGGFIGGWLTAWIHRHPRGLEGVLRELRGERITSRLQPEPFPLRRLREYSSFLTPRTGILSADTWTFVSIYFRNLLLNWTVIIPLLVAVLMLPRVANAIVLAGPGWGVATFFLVLGAVAVFLAERKTLQVEWKREKKWRTLFLCLVVFLLLAALGLAPFLFDWGAARGFLFVGTLLGGHVIAFMRLNRPSASGVLRPGSFWAKRRDQGSFISYCLIPLALAASLLTTFWAWYRLGNAQFPPWLFDFLPASEFWKFVIFGAVVGFLGWLLFIVFAVSSWRGRKSEEAQSKSSRILRGWWSELFVTLLVGILSSMLLYLFATRISTFSLANEQSPFASYSEWHAEWYTTLAAPAFLLAYFLGTTLFVGFTSRREEARPEERPSDDGDVPHHRQDDDAQPESSVPKLERPYIEDEDREWLARFSGWLVIAMAAWVFFSALVIFGPLVVLGIEEWVAGIGGLAGLVAVLAGGSARTPAQQGQEAKQGWKGFLARNMLLVAAFVFLVVLVVLLSFVTSIIIRWLATKSFVQSFLPGDYRDLIYTPARGAEMIFRALHYPPYRYLVLLMLALGVVGLFMSWVINLNKFSLHAGYRDRLIRAFLGASRLPGERRPNLFTGFDPRDNLSMHELRPGLLSEADFRGTRALESFVNRLKKVTNLKNAPTNADEYLRQRINDGQSADYFSKGAAEASSASFKTVLFADLNRILQTERLDEVRSGEGEESKLLFPVPTSGKAKATHEQLLLSARGDYRVLLNRLLLEETYTEELKPSSYPPPPYRLLHVVNMTLNLVGGDRLAWQQRKAESFTASPLHAGSLFVGYRPARDYGGRHGISLGTSLAVSGAAASSNMGYFSASPVVTFVMTIFNVRLGWWLGNPGVPGNDTYYRSSPRLSLRPVVEEAFGLTDDRNPYVLLSDGGHFDNLGLYEMVLRRSRYIVVVDGSGDPETNYNDLGNAVRKIRIDLGIDIDFKSEFRIYARPKSEDLTTEEHKTGGYCAIADIRYDYVDRELAGVDAEGRPDSLVGKLVYIKPAFYGREPRDIYTYAMTYADFPHESTADQFFDEPQFESHRMLGYYILEGLYHQTPADQAGDDDSPEYRDASASAAFDDGNVENFVRKLDENSSQNGD